VIPLELWKKNRLVKTVGFESPRDVGDSVKSSQVYSDQEADELILLNIEKSLQSFVPFLETVKNVASCCFVPLAVGGGIRTLQDADRLFSSGADKVVLNSVAYGSPSVLRTISEKYGRQAVIVGVDYRGSSSHLRLWSNGGRKLEVVSLEDHLEIVIKEGAGEIMLQSIDRDGAMKGYDLETLQRVAQKIPVPLILAGGAGDFVHLVEALKTGADAAACGSLFNFGDNNPLRAKAFLKNHGIPLKKI